MADHELLKKLQQAPDEAARHDGWTLEADGAQMNPIGISTDRLRLRRDTPSEGEPATLARNLAKRATYLLEPLAPIESDAEKALVRSREPSQQGEGRDYYEMWLTPDDLSIERYRGHDEQPRESRPINLTWEQAERLVRDVDAVYDNPAPGDE